MTEITQADREAAWPFRHSCYRYCSHERWMAGEYDEVARIIGIFARHRIATLDEAIAVVRGMLDELKPHALIDRKDDYIRGEMEAHRRAIFRLEALKGGA